jgi:hypothetical protein
MPDAPTPETCVFPTVQTRSKVYQGYLVRFMRGGKEEVFFSFDRAKAEEFAAKHRGIVSLMTETPRE